MGAVWRVSRAELRRRWASLLGVGLLVTLVSTVVLAALLSAQRTATSVDRFRDWAHASDSSYQSDAPERADAMLAAARDTPVVESATRRVLVNVFPSDGTTPDLAVMSDPEGIYGVELDRVVVLEGRLPAADAPDEVLLNELAARVTGYDVGDRIQANTWSTDDLIALFEGPDFPGFNGPALDLRVVGIGRAPEELTGDVRRTAPFALGSPSFVDGHPGIGAWPPAVMVRTHGGAADLDAVDEAIASVRDLTTTIGGRGSFYPDGTTAAEVYVDTSQSTVNSIAVGLLVFAGGAALAGGLAIGQAVQRQLSGSSSPSGTLRSLGLTRSEAALAHTLPIALVLTAATLVGTTLAVATTPLLPMGLAERAETDPGMWFVPSIVVVGSLAFAALVCAWTFLAARRRSSDARPVSARRAPAIARLANRLGAAPTLTTGIGLASDRGRGAGAVPVRSAVAGVTIAVAGAVGAAVIVASFAELESTPSHWGWTWSSMPDYFGDGEISALEARLVEDDRVEAVADLGVDSIVIDGRGVTSYALEPLKGSLSMTALDGRLPGGPGEVAMGQATMEDFGVAIGDSVEATRREGGSVVLTVVGEVVLPPTDEYALDVGAVLTPEGLATAGSGELLASVVLRYPDGVDADDLEAALIADYGFDFNLFTGPNPPGSIRNLVEGRDIAVALGVFFGVLAGASMLHALVVSTRRHRGDLAVLRAFGFRAVQVRRSLLTAGVTLAVGGLVMGVPLGMVAGRLIWRALVDGVGAVVDPQVPWTLLVVVAPAAIGLAAILSCWPGRAAVRRSPAAGLRAE